MKRIALVLLMTLMLAACGKKQGWQENRTHFDDGGNQTIGWFTENNQTYYLDAENGGIAKTGWLDDGGNRYFFSDDGVMCTGWQSVDGAQRFFLSDGSLGRGWMDTVDGTFYLTDEGTASTGWTAIDNELHYFDGIGILQSGIAEIDGKRYYLTERGCKQTGWIITEDGRYYLDADGVITTGWLEDGGNRYYLLSDGRAAVGRREIDGVTYYFTSTGANILLVNPWNPIPDDYQVDLVTCSSGCSVDKTCVDALNQMLADCQAAGFSPIAISGYRSYWDQVYVMQLKVAEFGSYNRAKTVVAVPGTSEHHTGLAVDITDTINRTLNIVQANNRTQQWLMEHCWDYGFILRYPDQTTDYTGIIYEPWHYRYVGIELAQELHELGICLEEYLDNLTGTGPSCGGIDKED